MHYKNYWLQKRKIRKSRGMFEGASSNKSKRKWLRKYLWCVLLIFYKDTSEIFSLRYFLSSPKKHFRLHLRSLSKKIRSMMLLPCKSIQRVFSQLYLCALVRSTFILDFHLIQSYAETTVLILILIFSYYLKISSVSNNKRNSRRKS